MTGIFWALVTVLAWGSWLAPSQNVPMKGQQTRTFYVTLAVMALAIIVGLFVGLETLTWSTFWFPFIGGLIWSVSGWSAFVGTSHLGMAKAFGIWAPLNIITSIVWGIILFGEFIDTELSNILLAIVSVLIIIGGILMIIFAGESGEKTAESKKYRTLGLLGAFGAGVGFATYFIPINIGTKGETDFTMWIGTLPLSIGMFVGAIVLVLISKSPIKLEQPSHYARVLSTGLLWGIGNYGALRMMEIIGTGPGFTIAQLCVVVNALIGIFWLKSPAPKSRAATLTLIGVIIAMIGGVILGNLKA